MAPQLPQADVSLAWSVHPARARPRAALAVSGYVALAAAALHLGFHSPGLTLLGTLLLLASVAEFLAPSRYRLSPAGAERVRLGLKRTLAWDRVRAAALADEGVLLSEVAERGLARAFRSLWLPAAPGQGVDAARLAALVDQWATARVRPSQEESDEPR